MYKFDIGGDIVEVPEGLVDMSDLLRTTLSTDIPVDKNENGIPIVEIATVEDVRVMTVYYNTGQVLEGYDIAMDTLLIIPRLLDPIKRRICTNRTREIVIESVKLRPEIWQPVRRFQDHVILLHTLEVPDVYHMMKLTDPEGKGEVSVRYKDIEILGGKSYQILDEDCENIYETLKKYRSKYMYMVVICDQPKVYSIDMYMKMKLGKTNANTRHHTK